jgi:hypothetical protein
MNKLTAIVTGLLLALPVAARADRAQHSPSRSSTLSNTDEHQILFGTDVDFALPIGNYSDINGVGGGVLLTAEYPLRGTIDQLSLTARVGFEFHADKADVFGAGTGEHVHSIPVLFGAKYYVMPDRQGLFGSVEAGLFDLMAGADLGGGVSGSSNDMKLGMGLGVGYAYEKWNARVNVHSHDVGNFGDAVMISAGIGYQFAGL